MSRLQTEERDEKSARADPFAKIQPMRPGVLERLARRQNVHFAPGTTIRPNGSSDRQRKIAEKRQAGVAERINVALGASGLSVDDFVDLGWELEQSVYATKHNWDRAVRVILGLYPFYESDSVRSHAVDDGLTVMERTCDLIRDL